MDLSRQDGGFCLLFVVGKQSGYLVGSEKLLLLSPEKICYNKKVILDSQENDHEVKSMYFVLPAQCVLALRLRF